MAEETAPLALEAVPAAVHHPLRAVAAAVNGRHRAVQPRVGDSNSLPLPGRDPRPMGHGKPRLTAEPRRARCVERRTPGSASGTGKRTGSNAGTAPRADSTTAWSTGSGLSRWGRPARIGVRGYAGMPAKDRAVLSEPGIPAFLLACIQEGLAAGPEGWVEDDLAFMAPWGVDLAGLLVPVTVWHGHRNWPTPLSHARWLADTIPGAQVRLFADEGALSVIFGHAGDVINWLGGHLHSDC